VTGAQHVVVVTHDDMLVVQVDALRHQVRGRHSPIIRGHVIAAAPQ